MNIIEPNKPQQANYTITFKSDWNLRCCNNCIKGIKPQLYVILRDNCMCMLDPNHT